MANPLLDLIAGVESPGYDVAYGGARMPPGMTLEQTLAWAKAHGQKTGSSAVGRYQFIRPTLEGLVKETGLPLQTPFSPGVQDMLATKLLKRRGLDEYAAGQLPPEQFARNLSQEWAGLPSGPAGKSFYAGDKMGNKAGIGWGQVLGTLAHPDVRQANAGVSDVTDRTPTGDPMTGLMDMQQAPMPPFPQMAPVEALAAQGPPESAPSMLELLALTAAGMAMGGGKGLSGALTGAGLAGGALRQQLTADQELWDLKQKRSDLMRKRQKQSALDEYAQTLSQTPGYEQAGAMMQMDPEMGAQYLGTMQKEQQTMALRQQQAAALDAVGRTQEAALVRSGMTPGTVPMKEPGSGGPEYGLQAQPYYKPGVDAKGQATQEPWERIYSKDGTYIDRPLPGPLAKFDPNVASAVKAAEAAGTAGGKKFETDRQNLERFDLIAPQIEESLAKATSSGLGAMRDTALGMVGISTEAGIAANEMKRLGALLTLSVPRMEGPQSDADTRLYREAVGQISDPTLPLEYKLKAWESIKEIAARQKALGNPYLANWGNVREGTPAQPPAAPAATGGWSIRKKG